MGNERCAPRHHCRCDEARSAAGRPDGAPQCDALGGNLLAPAGFGADLSNRCWVELPYPSSSGSALAQQAMGA
ncbi:MAG: hypothetical protein HC828_04755 [Blastochloris sp.]|nr:hypothetical protein [Blastochloris sp.]